MIGRQAAGRAGVPADGQPPRLGRAPARGHHGAVRRVRSAPGRGARRDGLAFDRFLAEFGVLILCRCCGCQIDPYDVQPVVESGNDPRDYDWTCERCE